MRNRTIAIALGALLATTALAAAPAMAQNDTGYSYSYTTTYPGTTYYTPAPTGLGGVGVYVRPGPYVPPPATPDPSFVPQAYPPSTAYVAPGTTTTTTTYVNPPTTTYVAPGTTYYVAPGTTTIYTTNP